VGIPSPPREPAPVPAYARNTGQASPHLVGAAGRRDRALLGAAGLRGEQSGRHRGFSALMGRARASWAVRARGGNRRRADDGACAPQKLSEQVRARAPDLTGAALWPVGRMERTRMPHRSGLDGALQTVSPRWAPVAAACGGNRRPCRGAKRGAATRPARRLGCVTKFRHRAMSRQRRRPLSHVDDLTHSNCLRAPAWFCRWYQIVAAILLAVAAIAWVGLCFYIPCVPDPIPQPSPFSDSFLLLLSSRMWNRGRSEG
jgi:hypothetical protein